MHSLKKAGFCTWELKDSALPGRIAEIGFHCCSCVTKYMSTSCHLPILITTLLRNILPHSVCKTIMWFEFCLFEKWPHLLNFQRSVFQPECRIDCLEEQFSKAKRKYVLYVIFLLIWTCKLQYSKHRLLCLPYCCKSHICQNNMMHTGVGAISLDVGSVCLVDLEGCVKTIRLRSDHAGPFKEWWLRNLYVFLTVTESSVNKPVPL